MDKPKLCAALEVPCDGTFQIEAVQLKDWGGHIILDCSYRHPQSDEVILFQIVLLDCRDSQWRVYGHISRIEGSPSPALVDIKLGADGHRKPLNLLTDAFGLTVSYGEIKIRRVNP